MFESLFTDGVKKLFDIFTMEKIELRLVGGCVRDSILGKTPKDIDLCTPADPERVLRLCRKFNIKFIETGLQHGTVTLIVNGEHYEVTTLRVDTETDGRHATVEYTTSFEKDAERRDFTFNAMSVDKDGVLHDYFGGKDDLENNRIRFVGDTRSRITEDYLRILRYFRFAARFNSSMDQDDLDIIEEEAPNLEKISKERIWSELSKILTAPTQIKYVDVLFDLGIFSAISLDAFPYLDKTFSDPIISLASIIDSRTPAMEVKEALKLSNSEFKLLNFLLKRKSEVLTEENIEYLLNSYVDRSYVEKLDILQGGANQKFISTYVIKEFPVSGKDIISLGIPPGTRIGDILTDLRNSWVVSHYEMTKQELLNLVEA